MNNIIQLDRLASLLKLQLSTNGRNLLLKLATLIVVVCLIYTFTNLQTITSSGYIHFKSGLLSARMMTIMASIFAWVSMISLSFVPYFNKGVAAASFMLPATSTEKFITQWFISMLIVPVAIVAVITLNDFIWMTCLIDMVRESASEYTFEPSIISMPSFEGHGDAAFALVSFLIMQSVLIFWGSVIFRRAQMMWTILSLAIIETTFFSILGRASRWLEDNIFNDQFMYKEDVFIVIGVVSLIVALTALFFSWKRFTRLQIKN